MTDNISITPGSGVKIPAKSLTYSGDTVLLEIKQLGHAEGSAVVESIGELVTQYAVPVTEAVDEAVRKTAVVAAASITGSFVSLLTAGAHPYRAIYGINFTEQDIELASGSSTPSSAEITVPAGCSFSENLKEWGLKETDAIYIRYKSVQPILLNFYINAVSK